MGIPHRETMEAALAAVPSELLESQVLWGTPAEVVERVGALVTRRVRRLES